MKLGGSEMWTKTGSLLVRSGELTGLTSHKIHHYKTRQMVTNCLVHLFTFKHFKGSIELSII